MTNVSFIRNFYRSIEFDSVLLVLRTNERKQIIVAHYAA